MLMMSQVAGLVVELRSRVSSHLLNQRTYLYVSHSLGRESIISTFLFSDFCSSFESITVTHMFMARCKRSIHLLSYNAEALLIELADPG